MPLVKGMSARLLVTIGTDGVTDWVRTPNGARHNLGAVSVLKFVTKLSRNKQAMRQALDAFLRGNEVMLSIEEDQMWALLAPRRPRWASDGSFITPDQRTTTIPSGTRKTTMDFDTDLTAIEQHIVQLDKAATGNPSPEHMAKGREILAKLAQNIRPPSQSQNGSYYGLVAADVHEAGDAMDATGEAVGGLSFDTYQQNQALAEDIIVKSEETNTKIDQLVAAGKTFSAARARADLYAVTSKVAGILQDVDLTTPWVQADLQKLAARADHLHGLFAPAKV